MEKNQKEQIIGTKLNANVEATIGKLTLGNIQLSTQLEVANEEIAVLTQKITTLETTLNGGKNEKSK